MGRSYSMGVLVFVAWVNCFRRTLGVSTSWMGMWRQLRRVGIAGLVVGTHGCGESTTQPDPLPLEPGQWDVVSTGEASTCALTTNSLAYCWGRAFYFQPPFVGETRPRKVEGSFLWREVVAGRDFGCGLTASGEAACWGWSGHYTEEPVFFGDVGRLTTVVSGVNHVCGLDATGQAYCWGDNFRGQLGIGLIDGSLWGNRETPTPVDTELRFSDILPGLDITCAVHSGDLYCWGGRSPPSGPDYQPSIDTIPVAEALQAWTIGGSAPRHFCGLSGGKLYCWGGNDQGQVGVGANTDPVLTPTVVAASSEPFVEVTAGGYLVLQLANGQVLRRNSHTCALTAGGSAYCWGGNARGQLGVGDTISRAEPTNVTGGYDFAQIAASGTHSCGVTREGEMYCWGDNTHGQLGDGRGSGEFSAVPVRVLPPN
jgi:serine/threonine-protein kinase